MNIRPGLRIRTISPRSKAAGYEVGSRPPDYIEIDRHLKENVLVMDSGNGSSWPRSCQQNIKTIVQRRDSIEV